MSFTDGSFNVLHGQERGFKMCILPLAFSDMYPLLLAFHLNWFQNDNERAEQSEDP